jgi:alkylated DNA repair dioxygenase AlkB
MDLFADQPQTVIADAEGGIRYFPDVVAAEAAARWFAALRDGADWALMQRPMYDRVVDVPRMLTRYLLDALPAHLAAPVAEMLATVQARAPGRYTSLGLNRYRDGADSVAMHGDKLHTIAAGEPIALLSLGAPRRMLIKAKAVGARAIALDLEPGSLLVMSHASQRTHEHGIPKTTKPVGERISAVFRARLPDTSR